MMTSQMGTNICYKKYSYKPMSGAGKPLIFRSSRAPGEQRGMTLIIGLILLVMLTVIGLIGFRNTTLSERMTGNAVDRNASFQSSENSGKEALQVIESGTFNPGGTTGHYGTPFTRGGSTAFWTQGLGAAITDCTTSTTTFSWQNCSAAVSTKYVAANNVQIKNYAQYAIELISKVNASAPFIYTYRVTTRSTGGSGDAEVVLQTIYTRSGP
jgi:type IV pilus assembly protein PilX